MEPPVSAPLLRPQRCATCGRLSSRVFTVGRRYVCAGCVALAIAELHPEWAPSTVAEMAAAVRALLDSSDPNGCAECARSHGPHYSGPCTH
jgi:hypothetical protein